MMEGLIKGMKYPPRIILYGPPGVGKSTFGADSPSPVFLAAENGVDNIPVAQTPKLKTWQEVLTWARRLSTEKHEHQTVVGDTINAMVELCAQEICTTQFGGQWAPKKGTESFLSFAQGWKSVSEELRALLALLDVCREKGMTILLLAHTGVVNVKNPIDGDFGKFSADIDKYPWARLSAWSDIILRADYEYSVVKDQKKARAVGTSTRWMSAAGHAAQDAKCRVGYELPDQMPLSWAAFAAELGKGSATLAEIKELWPILTADLAAKTLASQNVAKLEDLNITQARKLLDALRRKHAEKAAAEQAAAPVAAGGK